jgi:hypothetical protein
MASKGKIFFSFAIMALLASAAFFAAKRFGYPFPGEINSGADIFSRASEDPNCSAKPGFASNCLQNGLRLLRITNIELSKGQIKFSILVTMPQGVSGMISPNAYYWSRSKLGLLPIVLQGSKYPGSDVWLTGQAWATVLLPQSEFSPGVNGILTWDFINKNGSWQGPDCVISAEATKLEGCWRLATFNLAQ